MTHEGMGRRGEEDRGIILHVREQWVGSKNGCANALVLGRMICTKRE
jgi:hypothetical protein